MGDKDSSKREQSNKQLPGKIEAKLQTGNTFSLWKHLIVQWKKMKRHVLFLPNISTYIFRRGL